MTTSLKVLTLNCWGVFTPLACQYRHERMDAIADELSKADYDIVLLQEVWTQADYEKICKKVLPVMPYTHYWHSGMFGTGCCIFSKHAILETFLLRFSLNGYASRVIHGDWFGGKGVGLAKVLLNNSITVNVYSTHTHAQYNEMDEYEAHRVTQGYEMGQFIKHTSDSADVVVVGGDFNFQPTDLGYKLIKYNGNLLDAWISQSDKSHRGHTRTVDRNSNSFTTFKKKGRVTDDCDGCLDFVMFKNNSGYDMKCEKCYLTMGKIPDKPYHYSDHEGVAAEFRIRKNVTAMALPRETGEIKKYLTEAIPILDKGYKKVKAMQTFYAVAFLLCLVGLIFTSGLQVPFGLGFLLTICRFTMAVTTGACLWMGIVMTNREMNGLLCARKDINNLLRVSPQNLI